jgi:diguanylate cyclase
MKRASIVQLIARVAVDRRPEPKPGKHRIGHSGSDASARAGLGSEPDPSDTAGMIFGRRKSPGSDEVAALEDARRDGAGDGASGGGSDPIPADRALDFMAEMLRIQGEHAFDVGVLRSAEVRDFYEAWARHLLVGIPAPKYPGDSSPQKPEARAGGSRRDLAGLRHALKDHRVAEARYVTTAIGEFRDATWAFISGLRRSLSAEQASDRRISQRMRRLEGAVRSGDPVKIKAEAQDTVGLLTEFLAERGARHEEQITAMASRLEALREELDSVRAQASIDPVTQIYNRASFDEQIEREVDLATLFGKRGCLIMVDIDHFKWVNDTHGHPTGDHVLRETAATLTRCFKRKDDFVARYGGEEFAVVLRDLNMPTARTVAERGMGVIRLLEMAREGLPEPIRITASMGIARLRTGETAASWVERADRALYAAKNGGRDRIEVDPIDLEEK